MKKRLFNIHKLIGINMILFFFISLFFGILTIFQPYINLWEDSKQHIQDIKVENINLNKCLKPIMKRTYFGEKGEKVSNDFLKINLPSLEVRGSNLLRVINRPNFYIDPITCKKVKPKSFTISKFFDTIHTGGIFNSLLIKIVFGFMSVAVIFLSISGIFLIIKNTYKNKKTKTLKGFYAKYHRLLLVYTLPLVLMFGITGALFNLGVYSTPLITHYLTKGETINILKLKTNILVTPNLKIEEASQKIKSLDLNFLYTKAKAQFNDISFYQIQLYNYNDINARVKFIGYEPRNFFISSMRNETYVVFDANTAKVLDKKMAKDGTFTEKTLDSIFYLHYLRTFIDLPRLVFAFTSICILLGLIFSMLLWLERVKKDTFSFKILKPLSFTIILGSILSSALLFASAWLLPKSYMYFNFLQIHFISQEVLFYCTFLFLLIYILIKKDYFLTTKYVLLLSSLCLLIAVIAHNLFSKYNFFTLYEKGFTEILFTNIALVFTSILLFALSRMLSNKYFT